MSDRRTFLKQAGILGVALAIPSAFNKSFAISNQKDVVKTVDFHAILNIATLAPSPHNIQPWLFEIVNQNTLLVKCDTSKMIPVLDVDNKFMTLSMCLLVEYIDIVSRNFGYEIEKQFTKEVLTTEGDQVKTFCRLTFNINPKIEKIFDNETIKKRQTSRKAYKANQPIPQGLLDELNQLVVSKSSSLALTTDKEKINWIAELNRDAVFNDMDNNVVREEMKPWIRYTKAQAEEKRDGLWSKCMNFPPFLMEDFFEDHESFKNNPKRKIIEKVYYKKSKKTPAIMWLESEFESFDDLQNCGELLAHLGLTAAKHNCSLQPFGSIITNPEKKSRFMEKHQPKNEKNLWFIFRIGFSKPATKSYRIEVKNLIK
ncbi:MAG: twin-arginine translocation signal domain-containing protein [Putridiphycobacter sp.]